MKGSMSKEVKSSYSVGIKVPEKAVEMLPPLIWKSFLGFLYLDYLWKPKKDLPTNHQDTSLK